MALAQFGGRPAAVGGSGGGGSVAAKEIGEVMLVPKNFSDPNYVESGHSISYSSYPELFNKIEGATKVDSFTPYTKLNSAAGAGLIGARSVVSQGYINGETWFVTSNGNVVSTVDGIRFNDRGNLSNVLGGAGPGILWNVPGMSNVAYYNYITYSVYTFVVGSRVVILNTTGSIPTTFYTDDGGLTWTATYAKGLGSVASVTHTVVSTGTTGIIASAAEAWITTNGVEWTPAGFTPTSLPNLWADSNAIIVTCGTTQFQSADQGRTWTSTITPAAITVRYRTGSGALLGDSFATNTTVYISTDEGITWTAHGSATGALSANLTMSTGTNDWRTGINGEIVAASGLFTQGQNTNAVATIRTSIDGITWTSRTISNITVGQGMAFWWIDAPAGSIPALIAAFSRSTTAITATHGAIHLIRTSNGMAYEAGTVPGPWGLGFAYEDSATNDDGVTVLIGNSSNGATTPLHLLRSNVLVGNVEQGFTAVQLPDSDQWTGVTWNKTAGKFFITGYNSNFLYTSNNGYDWESIAATSLPANPKGCIPRTTGQTTFFLPTSMLSTAVPLLFAIAMPGESIQFFKTKFTATFNKASGSTATGILGGRSITESPLGVIASWYTTGANAGSGATPHLYVEDARWVSSTSSSNSPVASVSSATPDNWAVCHGNVALLRRSASSFIVYDGSVANNRTSGTVTVPAGCILTGLHVDGNHYTVFTNSSVIFSSVDAGRTWTSDNLTSVPADVVISYAKVINGKIMLFTNMGIFIHSTTASPTIKTLNNGWTAPDGLKYVVKAK